MSSYASQGPSHAATAETAKNRIITGALEILEQNPDGVRYSDLSRQIQDRLTGQGVPENTVKTMTGMLVAYRPNDIYKPSRGVFRLTRFRSIEAVEQPRDQAVAPIVEEGFSEVDFYDPFATYLQNELDECTKAICLGGSRFKDKWGTPDVIGIRRSRESDIIKVPTEIVSAEIKTDTNYLITAFGQACAYKLFSHKSYLVVPLNSQPDDIDRLDALCMIFGVGLILMDTHSPKDPRFEIRVRAAKHEPDMFYVNKNLKVLEEELFGQ